MWFLDFRTQEIGGPVASEPMLYEEDRWSGVGLADLPAHPNGITFVVHGFNNSRSAGRAAIAGFVAAAVQQVPSIAQTLFVGVLWPGDAVFGFLSYPTEEGDADRTAESFARLLSQHRLSPAPNFVAHSLGCRVVLRTIDSLERREPGRAWASQLVLLAGAVDDDVLGRTDRYATGASGAWRVVNVASTADAVLKYAFPAGDWLAGFFTGGYTRTALGRRGPATSPSPPGGMLGFQVGQFDIGHGDYLGGGPGKETAASAFAARALLREQPLEYRINGGRASAMHY